MKQLPLFLVVSLCGTFNRLKISVDDDDFSGEAYGVAVLAFSLIFTFFVVNLFLKSLTTCN